jgi:hypothetical protein
LKTKWDDFQYAYCMLLTIRVYLYKVLGLGFMMPKYVVGLGRANTQ